MSLWVIAAVFVGSFLIDFWVLALSGRGPIPWLYEKWRGRKLDE